MAPNFLVILATALIPLVIGYIWFSPSLFGGESWSDVADLSETKRTKSVHPLKLLLSVLFNFFLAFGLYLLCVHPSGVFGMVGGDTTALTTGTAKAFLDEYAMDHVNFGHGALHGFFATLLFALPFYGYVMIFEYKSAKYLFVNLGYWLINFILMGGILCTWGWKWIV